MESWLLLWKPASPSQTTKHPPSLGEMWRNGIWYTGSLLCNGFYSRGRTLGPWFLWKFIHLEYGHIKKRIDKGIGNVDWIALSTDTHIKHLEMLESDHCPIFLDTNPNLHQGPKPFHFQSMWTKHRSYKDTLDNLWEPVRNQHPILSLSDDFKNTKCNLIH